MSDEQKENGNKPSSENTQPVSATDPKSPTGASPETAAKAPAAKPAVAAAPPPPPPPEPGVIGKALEGTGFKIKHLGPDAGGIEMIDVLPADLLRIAEAVRDKHGFDLLLSCTGIDWKDRLESVYHLYNTKAHTYLTIRVTAENEHSPSLTPIYPAADWHERETYDLVGIQYDGHPNLTRILMPVDWLGHPLRKDYKVDDPRLVWNER